MGLFHLLATILWGLSPLSVDHPSLIDTEPEPSSVVANVNAISGKYASKYTDIIVQGAQPISLTRVYLGSVQDSKSSHFDITGGWRWFSHASAVIECSSKDPLLHVSDSNGTYLAFLPQSRLHFQKEACRFSLCANALEEGYCNTSRGAPSARHDIANTYVKTEKDLRKFSLHCSDSTIRYYKCIGEDEHENCHFLLTKEKHPNGNLTHYEYRFELKRSLETIKKARRYVHTNGLKRIWTSNPDESRTYAWMDIDYKGSRRATRDFEVTTSDSKSITYKYIRLETLDQGFWKSIGKPEVYLLSEVYGDNIKNQQIAYYTGKKHADPLIWLYQYPENRQQFISYYRGQGHDGVPIAHEPINIKDYKHPAYQRVKSITTYFEKGKPYIQYAFHPKPEEHTSKIIDSSGAYRIFCYDGKSRLGSIKSFSKDGKCLKAEKLIWKNYRLASRQLQEGSGQIINTRYYTYDLSGNVIKETLESPFDKSIITRAFSSDGKYLLQEKFPEGLVINYEYLPGTDLVTAKYTSDGTRIIKRQFWSYDNNNILIETIDDDGDQLDQNNLSNIQIRKIRRIKKNKNDNFYGMPEVIEDLYWCPTTKQEILLKKQKLHYDKHGNIEYREIFDANNTFCYLLKSQYDDHGNLILKTNPLDQQATFSYDANDNCIQKTDFGGVQTRTEFDLRNRPTTKTVTTPESDKRTYRSVFNQLDQITQSWDQFGNPTDYTYDPLGRCIAEKYPKCPLFESPPKHPITKKSYDAAGNITSCRDADGYATITTYNAFNKPLSITYPDHSTESYQYDALGRVTTHINKAGTATHYTYDVLGRMTKKSIEGEHRFEETFEYNGFACTKHTDAEGHVTQNQYDGAGRLIKTERDGHITTYAYDALGRQTTKTVQNNDNTLIYQTAYDLLDRPIEHRTLDQKGKTHFYNTYRYDSYGNKRQIHRFIDGQEAIEHFTYDGFGRLRLHKDPLGHETCHQYNESLLQKTTTTPNNIQIIQTSDPLQRPILKQKLQNKQEIFREERAYSLHGDLIALTNKTTTFWEYDACHRPIEHIEAKTRITKTTYTPMGQKATVTKPDGVQLIHEYNNLEQLARIHSSDNTIDYTYSYNRLGQLLQATDNVHSQTTTRTWDAHGNLLSETLANNLILTSQYDLANNKIELTYPDHSRAIQTYNGPHLSAITYLDSSGNPKASHQYTQYDLNNNPLTQKTSLGIITSHYNKHNTITQTKSPIHSHTIHEFDPAHNPLKTTLTLNDTSTTKTFAYDALDQLIAENENTYTYDSNYNRLSDSHQTYQIDSLNQLKPTPTLKASYDPNGNQTSTNTLHLEYDALDRLISVTQNGIQYQYHYDPLHRRIKSTTQNTETLYYYDHQNEIGSITAQSTEKRILGHGKGAEIGATIAIELNDEIFIPIHDLYGNIISIISNNQTQTYTYDAFGNHQPSHLNPWRYASKRCDPTGLIYFGKRFYDPTLGRWLTTDPAGYTDSSNLYQYNLNNPFVYTDFDGSIVFVVPLIGLTVEAIAVICVKAAAAAAIAYGGYKAAEHFDHRMQEHRYEQRLQEAQKDGFEDLEEWEQWKFGQVMEKRSVRPDPDPRAEGSPHTIIEKPGPEGQYTTHNGDGTFKQYRGSGKSHGDQPRPNIKENEIHYSPRGPMPGNANIRYPRIDEIPVGKS
ncbi:MAG: hypothetical protein H7A40_00025 [Chlamydiales bacterium]|nr:hypothetical protein [Chlamydiales bacterium]